MDSYITYLMRAWLDGCRESGIYLDLAILFLHGPNVKRDSTFAVEMLEDGIRQGNWEYCLTVGDLLANGNNGIVKDEAHALELFKQGAEHGVKGCKERLEVLQAESAKQK